MNEPQALPEFWSPKDLIGGQGFQCTNTRFYAGGRNGTSVAHEPLAGDLLTLTRTDTSGQLTALTPETTTYSYDNALRQITMTDALAKTTTYGYDSANNRTTVTDPLSHTTTYGYDADNRVLTVTDALSHTVTYGFDNNGNQTTVTDALSRTRTYGYDAQNRLITVTDPLTGVTTYAYDQASRQISITDADSNTTTYGYDNANRLTTVTDPNSHTTTYAYDNANRLTSVTDRDGRQITYSYDNVGNRTGETWVNGSYTATYTYDAANRLNVEQDTFSKYTLGYDSGNRLTSVDNNGTPNAPHLVLSYGYDHFGNPTSIGDSGASIALTYDQDNRLTAMTIAFGMRQPTVNLGYDFVGKLINITRKQTVQGGSTATTTYGYDAANRLTGITHSGFMTLTYGYDAANQLTSYSGPDGSITYGYDNDGQLTGASGAHNETYTYDKVGNRTITGYTTTIGNRLTADGTYTYSYDNDGNMIGRTRTSDSQVTTYTYDFRNRLTEVLIKTSTGTTVQDDKFTYDIENRRIGKNTLSGGQSWTAYNGVNAWADYNSSGTLTYRYLYGRGIDQLLGRVDTSGNTLWYLQDMLGSVRENVDSSGSVVDSITYDSYGNIISETHPSSGDRFKYTSREWDSEIGQYYYRARDYAPNIGRFESEDPSGFGGGDANLYRYVHNGPTNSIDAYGLDDQGRPTRPSLTPTSGYQLTACTRCHAMNNFGGAIGPAGGPSVFCNSEGYIYSEWILQYQAHLQESQQILIICSCILIGNVTLGVYDTFVLVPGTAGVGAAGAGAAGKPPILPDYNGTTSGVLITNEGGVFTLTSGKPLAYSNYPAAYHVEGQAAICIRQTGSSGGTLYINNPNGVCKFCNNQVPTLLPEGAPLNVVPPAGTVPPPNNFVPSKPYVGNSNIPKLPR